MFRQWSVRWKNRVSKIIVSKYWSFFLFLKLKKYLFCTLASKQIDKGEKKGKSSLQSWVKLVFFLQQWRCHAMRHCAVERSILPCCKQDKLKSYSLTQSRQLLVHTCLWMWSKMKSHRKKIRNGTLEVDGEARNSNKTYKKTKKEPEVERKK